MVMTLIFFNMSIASSESWFSSNNTVSTGKIVINGQEINGITNSIKGSGVKQTIARKVKDFSSVDSRGAFDIEYQHGSPSLKISGDDNLINHVKTKAKDKTLHLSIDKAYSTNHAILVQITSPNIASIAINGTSNVKLDGIETEYLKISLFGTADLTANGIASRVELNVQGSGDTNIKSLIADFVSVYLQGSGDIILTAKEQLDASISGVGDILFFGHPDKIRKKISGVGDIEAGE
jgi:hypothetical protein